MTYHDHIGTVSTTRLRSQNRLMKPAPFEPREHSHYWTHEEAAKHLEDRKARFASQPAALMVVQTLAAGEVTSWAELEEAMAGRLTGAEAWCAIEQVEKHAPDQLPFWIISPKFGPHAQTWTMNASLTDIARAVGAVLLEHTCSGEDVDALEILDWLSVTTASDILGALAELRAHYPCAFVDPNWSRSRPNAIPFPRRIWALANRAAGEACGEEDERFKRVVFHALRRDSALSPQARLVVAARHSERWPPRDAEELGSWIGVDPGAALEALWETNNENMHGPAFIPEWAAAHTCDGWNAKMDRAIVASPLTTRLALGVSSQLRMEGPWAESTTARDLAIEGWMTKAEVIEGARELRRAGLHHIHPWPAGLAEEAAE